MLKCRKIEIKTITISRELHQYYNNINKNNENDKISHYHLGITFRKIQSVQF